MVVRMCVWRCFSCSFSSFSNKTHIIYVHLKVFLCVCTDIIGRSMNKCICCQVHNINYRFSIHKRRASDPNSRYKNMQPCWDWLACQPFTQVGAVFLCLCCECVMLMLLFPPTEQPNEIYKHLQQVGPLIGHVECAFVCHMGRLE